MINPSGAPAICVRDINKRYLVYENQRDRLRHTLWPSASLDVKEAWVLRDIAFDIHRGESFGIVGRNGAGKSSLLQIIAGTLTATSGTVEVNGRLNALLELGSGFNPEYSGRDNVLLSGLLLGYTRAQIDHHFDAIAGFADLGDVLERPVKTYSSGMLVRLAFAVQIALEPDILIVDEALSVGDYFFQQKCFTRLRQMRNDGLTLLLVSHDMSTVRDTCDRVLYLSQGRQTYLGDAKEATRKYLSEGRVDPAPEPVVASAPLACSDQTLWQALAPDAVWLCPPEHRGRLLAVHITDATDVHTLRIRLGSTMVVRASFRTRGTGLPLSIIVALKNKYGLTVISTGTRLLGVDVSDGPGTQSTAVAFELDMVVEAGLYTCMVICTDQPKLSEAGCREDSGWIGPIEVHWNYETEEPPFFGMFGLPVRLRGGAATPQRAA